MTAGEGLVQRRMMVKALIFPLNSCWQWVQGSALCLRRIETG
jgi:hypothetical protein